jgi:hypothetical protein
MVSANGRTSRPAAISSATSALLPSATPAPASAASITSPGRSSCMPRVASIVPTPAAASHIVQSGRLGSSPVVASWISATRARSAGVRSGGGPLARAGVHTGKTSLSSSSST